MREDELEVALRVDEPWAVLRALARAPKPRCAIEDQTSNGFVGRQP